MRLVESILDGIAELRTHALRTVLQTLGIVLGVASLVAVQGLVDAGRRRTVEYLERLGGLTRIDVSRQWEERPRAGARERAGRGLNLRDARAIREEIPGVTFVDAGAGTVWVPARGGRRQEHVVVESGTPDYLAVNRASVARGRFLTDADLATTANVCVLGSAAARLRFGGSDPLGRILYIGGRGFTVVGVLARQEFYFSGTDRNVLEWLNGIVVIPATTMSAWQQGWRGGDIEGISVLVDRPESLAAAARGIDALLLRRHGGVRDFEIHRARDRLDRGDEQRRVFDITFLTIGAVSLLVGGIVIMNIMLASLQERVREVGLRKACGARRSDIAVQFLVESLLVAGIGSGAGLGLGVLFTRAVSSLLERPALITASMALVSVAAAAGVGLLFGLYPAVRASRLDPVEALRYE